MRGETYVREKSVHIHGKGSRKGGGGGGGRSDCVTGELRIQFGQKRRGKNLTSCRRSCFRSGIENLANKEREKERAEEVSLIFVSFKEIKKKKKENKFFLKKLIKYMYFLF